MKKRMLAAVCAMQAMSGFAFGQEQAAETAAAAVEAGPRWTLRVEPAVWFLGPAGTVKLPDGAAPTVTGGPKGGGVGIQSLDGGNAEEFDLRDVDIDTPEASLAGEIHLGRGDWRFLLRMVDFAGDQETDARAAGTVGGFVYADGDVIETSLDYAQFEFEVAYSFAKRSMSPYEGGYKLHSNFELIGGVRVIDVDWELVNTTGGDSAGASETFVEPLGGVRLTMELYEEFDIDVQVTAGGMPFGDKSTITVDAMVGGVWRPFENFGVQVGYRFTGLNMTSESDEGDYEWDGSMAGLYTGVVIQF